MATDKGFVPIEDVARYFRVSISTIRAWVRNRKIPADTYINIGNTYRFSIHRVEEALLALGASDVSSDNDEVEMPTQLELDFDADKNSPDSEESDDVWALDNLDEIDSLNDEIGLYDEDM